MFALQVMLELSDKAANRLYINPWQDYEARILPPCDDYSRDDNFLLIVVKSAIGNIAVKFIYFVSELYFQYKK